MIKSIQDYYQIDDNLATSGQPTSEQFRSIKDAGYQVIVNLAMSCSTNAISNEGEVVTDLGLVYVQIPVVWENPTLKDVRLFFDVMQAFKDKQVWVHCAKNMRVSCFINFWQKHVLKLSETKARYPMNRIWQPTGVWQELIEQVDRSQDNI
ncbi:MAG: protein tyrosine phosphatase family protein [Pleurocapsa sp.]